MNEYDLLRAIVDINEKYIENAVVEEEREPKRRKVHGMIAVAITLIVLAFAGIIAHWVLQRDTGNTDKNYKMGGENSLEECSPMPAVIEEDPSSSVEELPVCGIYQFMLWDGTEYIASVEDCDRIGAEMGTARVRNEAKESKETLFKDVVIYEFDGMDPAIAVLVYYPEEQEYYVYYNSTY